MSFNKAVFTIIGVLVRFGSALTGTCGPVIMLPILLLFGMIASAAMGIGQAIQGPSAVFAMTSDYLYGQIDFTLGITLGVVQAAGVILGEIIAQNLQREKPRVLVAITLIEVGLLMIGLLFI